MSAAPKVAPTRVAVAACVMMPLQIPPALLVGFVRNGHGAWTWLLAGFHHVARHTGLPVFVVAAGLIVVVFRLARKGARLVLEMTVASALVFGATKLGWIHW